MPLLLDITAYLSTVGGQVFPILPSLLSASWLSARAFETRAGTPSAFSRIPRPPLSRLLLRRPDACSLSERETNCNFVDDDPTAWWRAGWRNHAL